MSLRRGDGVSGKTVFGSKLFRMFLVLLLLLAAMAWWLHYSRQPATGTINPGVNESRAVKAAETTRVQHFKGTTAEFDYPYVYTDTLSNPASGQTVEQYSFGAPVNLAESRRISITIKKSSSLTPMNEDSAYKFRLLDSANYEVETVVIAGQSVEKFSKRDGSEVAYFKPGTSYYAIVVGSSTRVQGEFTTDTAMVMTSFAWR